VNAIAPAAETRPTQADLRFGIFLAPFHGTAENPTLAIQRDLELMEHLDRLGFDEAWIGEHHSGGLEIIPSERNASSWARASPRCPIIIRWCSRIA
jgi:alkanesulfonate monooxygenase SsuD/methylene tetrahydromethanopterin reductase-like flavin-dependent oxidoreductase (luciferase family)